ncbi:MAG: hypothetical protein KJO42_06615 [Silicimonas sp.]|nr:hypothetical protein [Silicimonas sp.]MBT8423881.1 hypothetical protein [Silicimonas sp.]
MALPTGQGRDQSRSDHFLMALMGAAMVLMMLEFMLAIHRNSAAIVVVPVPSVAVPSG